jgi:hypothetical protein
MARPHAAADCPSGWYPGRAQIPQAQSAKTPLEAQSSIGWCSFQNPFLAVLAAAIDPAATPLLKARFAPMRRNNIADPLGRACLVTNP